jgi:hypothetical protein
VFCVFYLSCNKLGGYIWIFLPGLCHWLQLLEADLLDDGSFDEAISGCQGVFHMVAPVITVAPDPKSSLSGGVRDMQMERNPNGEKEATVLCRAEVDQQPPTEKDPETETQPVLVDEVSVVLPTPGWKKWFISSRRLAAGIEEIEEGGSNLFSGEREPTIWDQINAENRRWVRQVLNPSHRRHLDLKFEIHSNSRDLRDLRLLGDSPPSLWCRNLVKSNARARFHSEYRGKTSSEIAASFPLFVKTIAGSSLCLQAQDSDSVFELKTQIHQATGTLPGFQ